MSVFERIRLKILSGQYALGESLNEVDLAEEFGISRTPIREAIRKLEINGLVERIPTRGVIVIGITQQDAEDIQEIRMLIEGVATKWAIERINDHQLTQLNEIFDLMEFYTQKKDVDKVFELCTLFHDTIYQAIDSPIAEHVLRDFQQFMQLTRHQSLEQVGRLENTLLEHKKILELFTSENQTQTKDLLFNHGKSLKKVINEV